MGNFSFHFFMFLEKYSRFFAGILIFFLFLFPIVTISYDAHTSITEHFKKVLLNPYFLGIFPNIVVALFVPWLVRKFREYSIKKRIGTNDALSDDCFNVYSRYFYDGIKREAKLRLPAVLRRIWNFEDKNNLVKINEEMIPLEATESSFDSETGKLKLYNNIPNFLFYLYISFLSNTKSKFDPILIQGTPGSGKTTLIFELFRIVFMQLKKYRSGWIPLILFAQDFEEEMLSSDVTTFKDFLLKYLKKRKKKDHVYGQLCTEIESNYKNCQYLFIIDGLDEILDSKNYKKYFEKIDKLISQDNSDGLVNRFIVTCRTEDNQDTINGTLYTLNPLKTSTLQRYFSRLRKNIKKTGRGEELIKIDNILTNLHNAKEQRLLQNYIENPYLFSIIREYYEDVTSPPATKLKKIFDHVLEKELERQIGKPVDEEDTIESKNRRLALVKYLKNVMGPYCFGLTVKKMGSVSGKNDFDIFCRYLKKHEKFYEPIFGNNGYVEVLYLSKTVQGYSTSTQLQKAFGKVSNIDSLGEIADDFCDHLSAVNLASKSHLPRNEQLLLFKENGLQFLFDNVSEILEKTRIAIINPHSQEIEKFKHNRMREFFASHFIEKVGVDAFEHYGIDLKNAWLADPLRIHAAITENPIPLLELFWENIIQVSSSTNEPNRINDKDFYLNAVSECVAYLPNNYENDKSNDDKYDGVEIVKEIYKLIHKFGEIAITVFTQPNQLAYSNSSEHRNQKANLTVLRNLFSSEFFQAAEKLDYIEQENQIEFIHWRKLHHAILKLQTFLQHHAYLCLFPISYRCKTVGISQSSLFFYVIVYVSCFRTDFQRYILELRDTGKTRIIPYLIYCGEKIVSIGFWLYFAIFLYQNYVAMYPSFWIVSIFCIVPLILYFLASIISRIGHLEKKDFWHLPSYFALSVTKQLYLIGLWITSILKKCLYSFVIFLYRDIGKILYSLILVPKKVIVFFVEIFFGESSIEPNTTAPVSSVSSQFKSLSDSMEQTTKARKNTTVNEKDIGNNPFNMLKDEKHRRENKKTNGATFSSIISSLFRGFKKAEVSSIKGTVWLLRNSSKKIIWIINCLFEATKWSVKYAARGILILTKFTILLPYYLIMRLPIIIWQKKYRIAEAICDFIREMSDILIRVAVIGLFLGIYLGYSALTAWLDFKEVKEKTEEYAVEIKRFEKETQRNAVQSLALIENLKSKPISKDIENQYIATERDLTKAVSTLQTIKTLKESLKIWSTNANEEYNHRVKELKERQQELTRLLEPFVNMHNNSLASIQNIRNIFFLLHEYREFQRSCASIKNEINKEHKNDTEVIKSSLSHLSDFVKTRERLNDGMQVNKEFASMKYLNLDISKTLNKCVSLVVEAKSRIKILSSKLDILVQKEKQKTRIVKERRLALEKKKEEKRKAEETLARVLLESQDAKKFSQLMAELDDISESLFLFVSTMNQIEDEKLQGQFQETDWVWRIWGLKSDWDNLNDFFERYEGIIDDTESYESDIIQTYKELKENKLEGIDLSPLIKRKNLFSDVFELLSKYKNTYSTLKSKGIDEQVLRLHEVSYKYLSALIPKGGVVVLIIILSYLAWSIKRKWSKKAGFKEVDDIKNSFSKIIKFLKENKHEIEVNRYACECLKRINPMPSYAILEIDLAIEARNKRGTINTKVCELLSMTGESIRKQVNR